MPGHTFFDIGMYDAALDVGQRSVAMDYADIDCCHPGYYSAPRFYHSHNVEFLIYAMIQTGHAADTVAVAQRANDPDLLVPALVAARDWKAVLALPYANANGSTMWFARDLALAKLGEADKAEADLAKVPAVRASEPARYATYVAKRATIQAEIALDRHQDAKALKLLQTASQQAAIGDTIGGRPEMPNLYYYSPHLALAELATKMGDKPIARAALDAELDASPKSPTATQALAKLNGTH
jgi:tetratricopeptide (TPR) repeat protein